jgi:chaperonin GroEL (HSP60 family)
MAGTGTRFDTAQGLDVLVAVASSLSQLLKTCYGPLGKEKIITGQDQTMFCSKSGSAILENLAIQHPAGALLVRAAQNQNAVCGDGTITVVMLIGYLMRESRRLSREGCHGSGSILSCVLTLLGLTFIAVVQRLLMETLEQACNDFEQLVVPSPLPHADDSVRRRFLYQIAFSQTRSKVASPMAEVLAGLCVDAALHCLLLESRDLPVQMHAVCAPGDCALVHGQLFDMPVRQFLVRLVF